MTRNQQLAALIAIRIRQDDIRRYLSNGPSPAGIRYANRELEGLEGAYDAIDAIETDG